MSVVIQIFARAPELGQVKTRLAAQLGDERALAVYEHLLDRTLKVAGKSGLTTQLRVAGDTDHPGIVQRARHWGCEVLPQADGNLGKRMHQALVYGCQGGGGALLVGSDCADLDPQWLAHGQQLLSEFDVVLGPSRDGGYYLVGQSQPDAALFADVQWSTALVRQQTLANAARLERSAAMLAEGIDIDTAEDLHEAQTLGLLEGL